MQYPVGARQKIPHRADGRAREEHSLGTFALVGLYQVTWAVAEKTAEELLEEANKKRTAESSSRMPPRPPSPLRPSSRSG